MSTDNYNEHSLDAVIARVDANLAAIKERQEELAAQARTLHQKHDVVLDRVTKLEQWRWYLVGVFAAGGIGGGVTADFVRKLLS
jgi:hypothetical protein